MWSGGVSDGWRASFALLKGTKMVEVLDGNEESICEGEVIINLVYQAPPTL